MAQGTIRAEVIGDKELVAQFRAMKGRGTKLLRTAIQAGALIFQNQWKENIVRYPVVKTGTYLRSVQMEVTAEREGFVEVSVGSDITDPPYPEFLEYGTRRMSARPTARPAFDSTQADVQAEIVDTMRELFRGY